MVDNVNQMTIKTYTELITFKTFEDRFQYLKLDGWIGKATFGFQRWINQEFYHSSEWLRFRNKIIIRDNGCDLGVEGFEIRDSIYIHHLNPITVDDIINRNPSVLDPENAICVRFSTHNAIHYGDKTALITEPIERTANDTCPWKR